MTFPDASEKTKIRIAYNQSAYIVKILLDRYGAKKIKTLWQNGMDSFKEIYGLSFENIISEINSELSKISPNQITLDWEKFNRECIK